MNRNGSALYIALGLVGLMHLSLLSACSTEVGDVRLDAIQETGSVSMSLSVNAPANQLLLNSQAWNAGDKIGVFAFEGESNSIYHGYDNCAYVTDAGDGAFDAKTDADVIYYPSDGSKLGFVAYAPYRSSLQTEGNKRLFTVQDWNDQKNASSFDLSLSDRSKGHSMAAAEQQVDLVMHHQFSKLIFNVYTDVDEYYLDPASLSELEVSASNMNVSTSVDLVTGELTHGSAVTKDIVFEDDRHNRLSTDSLVQVTAIICPDYNTNSSDRRIKFDLGDLGYEYYWSVPKGQKYAPGQSYTYKVTLRGDRHVEVTLVATINDWNNHNVAEVELTKGIRVSSIEAPDDMRLPIGAQQQVSATVLPEDADNKALEWTSSNPAVATITQNGLISCLSAGTTVISVSAKDGSGVSDSFIVECYDPVVLVTSITVPTDIELPIGTKKQISVTVKPSNATNPAVSWSSSNPTVATIDQNGNLSCLTVGTTTITVKAKDGSGVTNSFAVKCYDPVVLVTSITVPTDMELPIGTNMQISVTVKPNNATNPAVSWSSSSPAIASIDQNGNLSCLTVGTTTITIKAKDGSGVTNSFVVKCITPEINGHEYVDLGLPSGLKWAKCNMGASKESDYGYCYPWGGTMSKSPYNSFSSDLKKWGGTWRVPTMSEFAELKNNCTYTWYTSSTSPYNKIAGAEFSRNGKSVFFPAAGYTSWSTSGYTSRGTEARYWSSTSRSGYVFKSSGSAASTTDQYTECPYRLVSP